MTELAFPYLDKELFLGTSFMNNPGDIDLIYKIALQGKTYVEIGVACGASTCIAGLAGCEVDGIDPLDGPESDAKINFETGINRSELVRRNWAAQGLDPEKLHLHAQKHPPWPEAIKNKRFDIGFIDGDHTYDSAMADGLAMLEHIDKFIAFHDTQIWPERWGDQIHRAFEDIKALAADDWTEIPSPANFPTVIRVLAKSV